MFDPTQRNFESLGQIVADRSRSLVAWVGAGLSAPAGLPTWGELFDHLVDALQRQASSLYDEQDTLTAKIRAAQEQKSQDNMWVAFRILREALGTTSYQTTIRDALRIADRASIPVAYTALWRLRLSGILTLNLDRFATRAFSAVNGSKPLVEFTGHSAGQHAHILANPTTPFVANLHGTHLDATSWIFTDEDLNKLFADHGYNALVQTCTLSKAILFVGITANDIAAGGHLQRLRDRGIHALPHFWITTKRDGKTKRWAEDAGILPIYYSNSDGAHRELLECIDVLLRFAPQDPPAHPVVPSVTAPPASQLPPPEEMRLIPDSNQIRLALNAEAARLLRGDDEASYERYATFCEEYEEAIHRAWFRPQRPQGVRVFDYTIIREITKKGGFGSVYEAVDRNNNPVAIKWLHDSIRSEPSHLQSFRRGVRSMRLLSEENVNGVVRYHAAFEIPALLIMDYIPGPTLFELVSQKRVGSWGMILDIGKRVTATIRKSHSLPRGILHRDIRPQNVMFKEEWYGAEDWEIVVLDFDLSWHKDSYEKSVTLDSYSGYVAPEQIVRDSGYSTRSALVDSYGLGMTLFFLRTGVEPRFLDPGQREWLERLEKFAHSFPCGPWRSLPRRFFRLIFNCTYLDQPRRWDVGQIENEISRMHNAFTNGEEVRSPDLLAEELLARAFPGDPYDWNQDTSTATRQIVQQTRIAASVLDGHRGVGLEIAWIQTGDFRRGGVVQWATDTLQKLRDLLCREGWDIVDAKKGADGLVLTAAISTDTLAPRLTQCARALARISDALTR